MTNLLLTEWCDRHFIVRLGDDIGCWISTQREPTGIPMSFSMNERGFWYPERKEGYEARFVPSIGEKGSWFHFTHWSWDRKLDSLDEISGARFFAQLRWEGFDVQVAQWPMGIQRDDLLRVEINAMCLPSMKRREIQLGAGVHPAEMDAEIRNAPERDWNMLALRLHDLGWDVSSDPRERYAYGNVLIKDLELIEGPPPEGAF